MNDAELWDRLAQVGGLAVVGLRAQGSDRGMSLDGRLLLPTSERARGIDLVSRTPGVVVEHAHAVLPHVRVRVDGPAAIAALRRHRAVEFVEPAIIASNRLWASDCSEALYDGNQFTTLPSGDIMPLHYRAMKIDKAWKYATGDSVTVGVTDTGIDPTQPELNAEFASGESTGRWIMHRVTNSDVTYQCSHGTHVAGVIGAPKNGKLNIGVAWRANMVSEYQSNTRAAVNNIDAGQAIYDAAAQGAKVISMAWQALEYYDHVGNAIRHWYYNGNDVLFVGAAGTGDCSGPYFINEGNIVFPAEMPEVLAVSAANLSGSRPCAAHYGPQLDLLAYHDMPTTPMGGKTQLESTAQSSNATAVVSGVAALVRERYPNMTNAEVMLRLENTAGTRCGMPAAWASQGVVNALAAVGGICTTGVISGPSSVTFTSTDPAYYDITYAISVTGGLAPLLIRWSNGSYGPTAVYRIYKDNYVRNVSVSIWDPAVETTADIAERYEKNVTVYYIPPPTEGGPCGTVNC